MKYVAEKVLKYYTKFLPLLNSVIGSGKRPTIETIEKGNTLLIKPYKLISIAGIIKEFQEIGF
jgi:hypothetical protein